jgi:hypothetical protein
MADLKTKDKHILESLFKMGGGYVLDFSDRTIGDYFSRSKIFTHGNTKVKK